MQEHGVRNPLDAVYQAMANAFNLELLKDGLAHISRAGLSLSA